MEKQNEKQANNLQREFTFIPTNQKIRVEIINEQPWFVVKDVCYALELADTNKALLKIDNDEKLTRKIFVSGQSRNMKVVNESGLYALIMRSSKPEAKKFRKWVTSEVLPSIRRSGHYGANSEIDRRIEGLEHGMTALMEAVTNLANAIATEKKGPEVSKKSGEKRKDVSVIDARHKAFDFVAMLGANIRHIVIDEKDWYSMNDILTNMRVRTSSCNTARKLGTDMTCKIWIFGNTHPAWFVSKEGAKIVMAGSRKLRSNNEKGGQS